MRGKIASSFVALAVVASIATARATTTSVTFYLHSLPPAGNTQEAVETAAGGTTPAMDTSAPATPAPSASATTALGNPAFRKNPFFAYWSADLHGSVSNAVAHVWVTVARATSVTAALFSGPVPGTSSPFASAKVAVKAGAPVQLDIPLGGAGFSVLRTLVLQIQADDASNAGAVAVLYDSTTYPSSLTFDEGPYVALTPPAWTPSAGFGPVTLVSSTLANRETSLAVDPTDERRMVTCSPSGVPNYPYGQSYFHITNDEGTTWHPLYVETSPTDSRRAALEGGDCDVAFDAGGTMYSADTWLADLSVGASRDHGETWSGTALATTAPIVDRPWLVGGPAGTVHVTWQDLQTAMPTAIWYTRSTDYGQTFRPAVLVAAPDAANPMSWEGNFVVSPDGNDLHLVYTRRFAEGPTTGAETVWVATSHDGGATWASKQIASPAGPASFLYASIGRDAAGGLYVVYSSPRADEKDQPVWMQTSNDDGVTWTDAVPLMTGVASYAPWVVGGAAGEAAVQWYGTLDGSTDTSKPHDWYLFTARASSGTITAGPTTQTPVFSGIQDATPEFNEIRLDSQDRVRLAESVYYAGAEGTAWSMVYQEGSAR